MEAKVERSEETGLYSIHLLNCTPEDTKDIQHFVSQLILKRINEKLTKLDSLLTKKLLLTNKFSNLLNSIKDEKESN